MAHRPDRPRPTTDHGRNDRFPDTGRRRILLGGGSAGLVLALAGCASAEAQDLGDILRGALGNPGTTRSGIDGVTREEADSGLREALIQGAVASALRLGQTDGYWGDAAVRIPLPGRLGQLQRQLDRFGMGGPLNDLQLRLNRGAEAAAPAAVDIFTNASRGLSITDVIGVLRGGETAATDLLASRTRPQLLEVFTPPVREGLDSSGAGQAFDRVRARYGLSDGSLGQIGQIAGIGSGDGSLKDQFVGFAVGKALDGLFH